MNFLRQRGGRFLRAIVDDGAEPARGSIYPCSRSLENTVQFVSIGFCVSWVLFSGSFDSRPCFARLEMCAMLAFVAFELLHLLRQRMQPATNATGNKIIAGCFQKQNWKPGNKFGNRTAGKWKPETALI